MNKRELVASVAQKKGISQKEAEKVLDGVLESITEALCKKEPVVLIGFGSFSVKKRAARGGYNPRTKEKIVIPSKQVVRFRPGAKLELL
ncbi:HU family DNA-binding protein [uncultured Bacteroides sp.]|jgi:bacterial nucleoid protein Hbs|uniref:HU family DNA-binding protein n=1 Tax=uncultured Bacteroides sp. TaxID=162156 RepID=UPI002675F8F8|nr:HU family DNA-binding protein [uncultured Bacteroides sp.]